jgi:hypothetical protein
VVNVFFLPQFGRQVVPTKGVFFLFCSTKWRIFFPYPEKIKDLKKWRKKITQGGFFSDHISMPAKVEKFSLKGQVKWIEENMNDYGIKFQHMLNCLVFPGNISTRCFRDERIIIELGVKILLKMFKIPVALCSKRDRNFGPHCTVTVYCQLPYSKITYELSTIWKKFS